MIKSNYAYGIYRAGNQTFLNKSEALYYASHTGSDVVWDFHDTTYSKFDWTKRPNGNLLELYRQRAQQIRDSYDYIIVHFSGGADSWTVLDSFLSNGIHVDEICSRWARDERKYIVANNTDNREFNLSSEYEYAAEPVLKEIEKNYPQTYIYIDDYSDAYQQEFTEKDIMNVSHYTTLGTAHRFTRKSPNEIQAVNRGQRVGVIYGFDKIQCLTDNGKFYAFFTDRFGAVDSDSDRSVEAFYWSPSFPVIPILQAHALRDFYISFPKLASFKEAYIPICYPKYNTNTFQVRKPVGSEVWASETWIHKYNPRYVESWKWNNNQYFKSINSRFLNYFDDKIRLGFKPMRSSLYYVGSFDPKINLEFHH